MCFMVMEIKGFFFLLTWMFSVVMEMMLTVATVVIFSVTMEMRFSVAMTTSLVTVEYSRRLLCQLLKYRIQKIIMSVPIMKRKFLIL